MIQLSGAVCQISAILKFKDTVQALKHPSADAVTQNGCTIGNRAYGTLAFNNFKNVIYIYSQAQLLIKKTLSDILLQFV